MSSSFSAITHLPALVLHTPTEKQAQNVSRTAHAPKQGRAHQKLQTSEERYESEWKRGRTNCVVHSGSKIFDRVILAAENSEIINPNITTRKAVNLLYAGIHTAAPTQYWSSKLDFSQNNPMLTAWQIQRASGTSTNQLGIGSPLNSDVRRERNTSKNNTATKNMILLVTWFFPPRLSSLAFGTTGRTENQQFSLTGVTALATCSKHNYSSLQIARLKDTPNPRLTESARIVRSFGHQLAATAQHHSVPTKYYRRGIIRHKNLQLTHSDCN